jgi:hypothetical protein
MKKTLLSILLLFAFVSGAYSQFSPPAQGLAFGNGSYVKVPDNSSLQFGAGDFTIETWTKKNSSSSSFSNSGVVMKWNTGVRPGTNEWALNNTSCVYYGKRNDNVYSQ